MNSAVVTRLTRTRLLILLGLIYLMLVANLDFLRFPVQKDELHFWPTTLSFSTTWIPSLDQLRWYGELSTPLPFLVFGAVEHMFHGGIAVGRLFNLLLSFGLAAVMIVRAEDTRKAALATAGLLAFPYYLGVSTHLYTDIMAAGFVLLGLISHLEGKPFVSAVCWTLAIASRQSAAAFPLAMAAYELSSFRRGNVRWISPAVGAATLGLWFAWFGGPGPMDEYMKQEIGGNRLQHLHPDYAIYLLSCVGLFYVIPEFLLFPEARPPSLKLPRGRVVAAIAVVTVLAGLYFAPLGNDWGPTRMGLFDRLATAVLGSIPRALFYGGLAALAVIRFSERTPASFLVAANAGLLVLSFTMWEKYALPLMVCLWYLRARLVESSSPPVKVS